MASGFRTQDLSITNLDATPIVRANPWVHGGNSSSSPAPSKRERRFHRLDLSVSSASVPGCGRSAHASVLRCHHRPAPATRPLPHGRRWWRRRGSADSSPPRSRSRRRSCSAPTSASSKTTSPMIEKRIWELLGPHRRSQPGIRRGHDADGGSRVGGTLTPPGRRLAGKVTMAVQFIGLNRGAHRFDHDRHLHHLQGHGADGRSLQEHDAQGSPGRPRPDPGLHHEQRTTPFAQ
jgi:hypothetical protein